VSFLLAGAIIAIVITALTPKKYEATAQILVQANSGQGQLANQDNLYVQTLVQTYANIVDNPAIFDRVRNDIDIPLTDSQLKSKINASAPTGQSIVLLHATDGNADRAAKIANSAAKFFVTTVQDYATVSATGSPSVRLFVTAPATAPSSPQSPKPVLNITLGILLGLLVGAALAVARDILDNRIKNADTLSKVANSPTMGVIVEDPKTQRHPIATRAGTRNMRAENYRQLRANLQFANVDQHPRVIAVTSSIPGEGKTTVAINLASTLAEAGFSVCLVDSDLRRPTIAKALGLLSPVGLTSVLIHQIELTEALQNAGSSFYVLTSGPTPPNPSEVLASSYVRDVIRSLLDKVDYVVCDTAPLLPVADGSEVAALADGTLLVARHGVTTDTHIKRAVHTLGRVDARVLGVVLNRVPPRRNNEYGYTYYRAEDTAPTHARDDRETRRGRRNAAPAVEAPAPVSSSTSGSEGWQ
jgi:capsular exopolysaccharide synthesis family protein